MFRLAVAQMNTRDCKEENLKTAEGLIDRAAGEGARMVVLPENFNYLGPLRDRSQVFENLDGPSVTRMREKAQEQGIYVHCGSIRERCPGDDVKSYNTTVVLDPRGEIIASYRKIHLFDIEVPGRVVARESDTMIPGRDVVSIEVDGVVIGLTICYDMRFPELYRLLMLRGAHLVLVPAAFTLYTGKDHWEPILRTRAIENTYYVAAAAQIGPHPPDKQCFGSSMIIDPWGTVVARASERETVVVHDLDLEHLREVRTNLPSLGHRIPEIYGFREE